MFELMLDLLKRLLVGRLFADNDKARRKMIFGVSIGVVVGVIAAQFLPIVVATAIGGAVSGFVQPMLFKDLRQI